MSRGRKGQRPKREVPHPCFLVRVDDDVHGGRNEVAAIVNIPDDKRRLGRHFKRQQFVKSLKPRLTHANELCGQDLT